MAPLQEEDLKSRRILNALRIPGETTDVIVMSLEVAMTRATAEWIAREVQGSILRDNERPVSSRNEISIFHLSKPDFLCNSRQVVLIPKAGGCQPVSITTFDMSRG